MQLLRYKRSAIIEKGFRILMCVGCPAKLKVSVSKENYGKILRVRCPKCSTVGRLEIPYPATSEASSGAGEPRPYPDLNSIFRDLGNWSGDIFGDFFKPEKK